MGPGSSSLSLRAINLRRRAGKQEARSKKQKEAETHRGKHARREKLEADSRQQRLESGKSETERSGWRIEERLAAECLNVSSPERGSREW